MTNTPTRTEGSPRSSDGDATDRAGTEARHVAETGRQKAGQVAGEAQSQAVDLARTARDQAKHRVDGEVGRLAGLLGDMGEDLDGMAARSDDTDRYMPALARDGAQVAKRLSRRLESGGVEGVLHDVEDFARRRPGMFLAAAFGAGLALGRVTRNADMHAISDEMHRGDGVPDSPQPRVTGQMSPSASESGQPTVPETTQTNRGRSR